MQRRARKQLLDEIMKLQIHQVSPLIPAQYTEEYRESKEGLKAAYPLYFSYPQRNKLPIETLEKMKKTLIKMKADLQKRGITPFLSEEFKERAAAHRELTHAWHKAQNAFKAHPLAEHMEFGDFEQEVEFHLELEEGLLGPDFVGGLEVQDLRRYRHLWDKIAKGLERNVNWVQKILKEAVSPFDYNGLSEELRGKLENGEPIDVEELCTKYSASQEEFERTLESMRKLVESLQQHIEKNREEAVDHSDTDKIKPNAEKQQSDALHNERALCAGHIAAAEHDFNQLRQKHNLQADFQDFYAYACEYFEEQRNLDLSRYVDGLRSIERIQELLAMWKGVVTDIGAEADWIKAFVDKHTPKGTVEAGLQIEPLGPSNAGPEAESGETTAIPFEELDTDAKVHIRFAMDRVRVLTKIEGLPDTIITLSEKLCQALTDYAPDYSADAGGE